MILKPAGIDGKVASWIGTCNGLAGNLASVLDGWIMDRFHLQQRLKSAMLFGLLGCGLATAWFSLQLPSVIWSADASTGGGLLPQSTLMLILSLSLAGFFQGVTSPMFYEL